MSTLGIDYPSQNPGVTGLDGLNDYQRSHLKCWMVGRLYADLPAIQAAVLEDPRLLEWADWRTIMEFGQWLRRDR
jgi:hypothetical protein